MFKKILIANRGEIAVRIIRACKEMGIKSVAVYSEADVDSLHVKFADEAYCIGPAPAAQSYLHIPAVISAAEVAGVDAIHPGYGFLAENSQFCEICQDHNIVFIGASSENLKKMGDKNEARTTMKALGIPVVPGTDGIVHTEAELEKAAKTIGFPLIIKATAGGGGKGMRIVDNPKNLVHLYNMAKSESQAAFGNGDVYVEKYIEDPHHIEFQILSDRSQNAVHLGERDCSIQRRHQKLIEESPSPFLTDELREKMGAMAVKAAKGIRYHGAGTIEFLVDKHHNFYFMEMNTRIQVEHPVTELVTNIDLIKEQIKIAATNTMGLNQSDIQLRGHAIEFRINAEDHLRDFAPAPGKIELFLPPGGIGTRTDSHIYPGYNVPPHYDSLLGKLIVWGNTRQEAIARAARALDEFIIDGVPTTLPFHQKVLQNKTFLDGNITTHFIDQNIKSLTAA